MKIRGIRTKLPGTMIVENNGIFIFGFYKLNIDLQRKIIVLFRNCKTDHVYDGVKLYFKDYKNKSNKLLISKIGRLIDIGRNKNNSMVTNAYHLQNKKLINFSVIHYRAKQFAILIKSKTEDIVNTLDSYETYNVVLDEIERSVDLLENLDRNKQYFKYSGGNVSVFLPLNQPLYATICFVVVPSMISNVVTVLLPLALHSSYKKLDKILRFSHYFPNIKISYVPKDQFIKTWKKVTDTVIFTGTCTNGKKVYKEMKPKLFIFNGAGHNPVVVTPEANIKKAVDSILRLTLQNQGQDCAAPNSILVQKSVLPRVRDLLIKHISLIYKKTGDYKNHVNIVGPNTESNNLIKICKLLDNLKIYIIKGGDINIKQRLIYPTLLEIPLKDKPMFVEFFAPIIAMQPYLKDSDLKLYFENPQYYPNAMYVTVFGRSRYIKTLITKGFHSKENILYNTDLHREERGFLPYGGLGPEASYIFVKGTKICGATLPQRDLYNFLLKT